MYSAEALDLADYNEPRPTHAEILARNARWSYHWKLRLEKGRPVPRVVTRQWRPDWKHYPLHDSVAPDPILNLLALRSAATQRRFNPRAATAYGELRQRVVSPLDKALP